jgi:methyltransferase
LSLFVTIISIVIFQRVIELIISNRNERWLLSRGAVEYGNEHYKLIVILHTSFFISMIVEYIIRERYIEFSLINYILLIFFVLLQLVRIWVLSSLGKYWNTKILRVPGSELISKGPYRFFKHPNYLIVAAEIFVLPMIFNLYFTAIVFTVLNAVMLRVRIRVENEALKS